MEKCKGAPDCNQWKKGVTRTLTPTGTLLSHRRTHSTDHTFDSPSLHLHNADYGSFHSDRRSGENCTVTVDSSVCDSDHHHHDEHLLEEHDHWDTFQHSSSEYKKYMNIAMDYAIQQQQQQHPNHDDESNTVNTTKHHIVNGKLYHEIDHSPSNTTKHQLLHISPSTIQHHSDTDDELINTTSTTSPSSSSSNSFQFIQSGSILSGVFNLCSATLGAGVLALPYAFTQAGLLTGIILLLLAYALSCYSVELLIATHGYTRSNSYESMSSTIFHKYPLITKFVGLNIFLFCIGTMTAYSVTSGDIVQSVFHKQFHYQSTDLLGNRNILTILFTLFIMLPLSCLEQINELRFTSFLCVSSILFLITTVMYRTIQYVMYNETFTFQDITLIHYSWDGILNAITIIMFAYTNQPNIMQIYNELTTPTPKTMRKVVTRSFGLSTTFYVCMGIAGMLRYGRETESDILNNIDVVNDPLLGIAEIGLALSICMAYPLNVFPARQAIEQMLWKDSSPSNIRFYLISIGLVLLSLLLALTTRNLSTVFSLIGSTTSSIVCFILPATFYLASTDKPYTHPSPIMACILGISGVLIGVIATTNTIINITS